MSAPCPTCQAVICSDVEDSALYNIERPFFPFVLECPPGFDCSSSGKFKMVCCGTLFSVDFPPGVDADTKNALIQSVVNQCSVLLAACGFKLGCLNPPCDPPPPTTELFYNRDQTCNINCPDGTTFVYTVVAGTFAALTQNDADQQALDYACNQVALRRVCMGNFSSCLCVGSAYSQTIPVTGGLPPFTFSLFSGSLPDGLTLSHSGTITGTPSTSGNFSFRVKVVSGGGGEVVKPFQMAVLEIASTQLPAFTVGVPYSYQLLAAGGSGNYLWKIVAGTLPPGLTMSNTGLISGTPT